MSIGSIIEPNMHRGSYDSHSIGPSLHEMAHAPIGTAPRSLPPELLYGLSPSGDSPLYSSSDSCYSPLSDYLQPQAVPQQYYPQEVIQRPHSTSIECGFQPIIQSPLSAGVATPSWSTYDPSVLAFPPETSCLPPVSQFRPLPIFFDSSNHGLTHHSATPILLPFPLMARYLPRSAFRNDHARTTTPTMAAEGQLLSQPQYYPNHQRTQSRI